MTKRDAIILQATLDIMLEMVLKTGTEKQIELAWGILKSAKEEMIRVVPLRRRPDPREEMQ